MKAAHYALIALGVLVATIVINSVLVLEVISLNNKLDAAANYINRLESDYPDYIDTSAESDEYYEYYK